MTDDLIDLLDKAAADIAVGKDRQAYHFTGLFKEAAAALRSALAECAEARKDLKVWVRLNDGADRRIAKLEAVRDAVITHHKNKAFFNVATWDACVRAAREVDDELTSARAEYDKNEIGWQNRWATQCAENGRYRKALEDVLAVAMGTMSRKEQEIAKAAFCDHLFVYIGSDGETRCTKCKVLESA